MRTMIMVVVLVALTTVAAYAAPGKCERTIIKESAKFTEAAMQIRAGCAAVRSVDDCLDDPFVMIRIGALEAKLRQHVQRACGGRNSTCNSSDTGNNADEPLASIGWDRETCPGFENSGCTNPIADCNDVADCIVCISNAAQSQAVALYYGALDVPTNDPALRACKRRIGVQGTSVFRETVKALATCERKVLSGTLTGPCPDPKTQQKIDALQRAFQAQVCGQCGGHDRMCGGADDRSVGEIGFTPACPDVTVPGGASCGGAVASVGDVVECVDCVTDFKVDCLDALAVPELVSYPSACQ